MDEIKKYAVTGFPVSHSKSPWIFNRLFSMTGFPGRYTRISAATGEKAFEMFLTLGLTGMNITSPLKDAMMTFAEIIDEPARRIGCINTLYRDKGAIRAANTDHLGVSGALQESGVGVAGKKCLVMGAGNAGRAAVHALKTMGGEVTVVNRTFKKAHILAGDMDCRSEVIEKLHALLSGCSLLVSTIPGGSELIRESWLHRDTVILDADYLHSPLRETAEAAGCRYIPGESWLWHQAAPAFHLFTGGDIPGPVREEVRLHLEKPAAPVTRIRLAGGGRCIHEVEKKLKELQPDFKIQKAEEPEVFTDSGSNKPEKGAARNILIYSGDPGEAGPFIHGSDLIVWGRGDSRDCAEGILKEISHVR